MRRTPARRAAVGEGAGHRRLGALEVRPGADRVHQVVGDVDAGHRAAEGRGVGRRRRRRPRRRRARAGRAGGPGCRARTRTRWPGGQQLGDEPAADVAGGAGDEAERGRAWVPCASSVPVPDRRRKSRRTVSGRACERLPRRDAQPPTGGADPGVIGVPSALKHSGRVRTGTTTPCASKASFRRSRSVAGQRDLLAGHGPWPRCARTRPRRTPPPRRRTSAGRASASWVSGSSYMSLPTSIDDLRGLRRGPRCSDTGITAAASVQPCDWLATRRISPLRTYQTTPVGSRIRVTRRATSSTVPDHRADVDEVADAVLVLDDHEEARQVVLDQGLRAEAQRDADDAGAGDQRARR